MSAPYRPEAEVVDICRELIRIDTSNFGPEPGPGERVAAERVAELLDEVGIESELIETEPRRTSLVAHWAPEETLLRTTRALTHSEVEVFKAYERCVFNVIFNNRDDHTKNFSFRMDESLTWELSPCYDLTYCPGLGGEHQMTIGGEGRNPSKKHLLQLARTNGIAPASAQDVIERIAGIAVQFKNIARNYPIRGATRTEITRVINGNCDRMA